MSETITRSYVVLRPRHRLRRTARAHLALVKRAAKLADRDPDDYGIMPAPRGPARWYVVRY